MVRGSRGKHRGGHGGRNRKRQSNRSATRPQKPYKFQEPERKRPKLNKSPIRESSSEDEEVELQDHMKQLQSTFKSNLNDKRAVDSESSESEDEIINDNINKDESKEVIANELSSTEQLCSVEDDESELEATIEENEDAKDPFVKHLFYDLHEKLLNSLQNLPPLVNNFVQNWPKLGRLSIQIPQFTDVEIKPTNEISIDERKVFAPAATVADKIESKTAKPSELFIKSQISNNLATANSVLQEDNSIFTPLQAELFSVINNYQDLYYGERTFSNAEEIRFIYCLHAVNHILKTRMKVIHHNARLSNKDDVPEEFRDQGLVRPKILIILPFRDAAYKVINTIIDILIPENKGFVMNRKRFIDEFTGHELVMPKKNPKPEDYELTFSGNSSDDFRIGMTVTKKSLKLFADFYSSDIIVASPLGLRTIIGAKGEAQRDYDFLASVELLILDQTELFLMQNWDHLLHVINHLHLQPKDSHGTDFSRVRTWCLNGWAKYYRQTLIFSSIMVPEINALFNKKCNNYAGKVKVTNLIEFGSISQVFVQLPHVFHKFGASTAQEVIDARFQFFINKVLPLQKDGLMKQTMIFVSSYFDYVRLRNYFKKEDIGFVQICEYSKEGKVARARDMFFHGDAHFLLYTERYHFFNRVRVKGIRHLVFYQPPTFPNFYYEMCNLMQEGNMNKKIGNASNMTVSVIYSKYDLHQLAAIVGTERAAKMMQSEKNVHMMVTGGE